MSKKILVVDDEPDILKVVAFRLIKLGYDVAAVGGGEEALDLLFSEQYDLVVLDVRMPNVDGYEVCKKMKQDENLKNIPVIFLTASTAPTVSQKSKELGANDYLVKPFEPEELLQKIHALLYGKN